MTSNVSHVQCIQFAVKGFLSILLVERLESCFQLTYRINFARHSVQTPVSHTRGKLERKTEYLAKHLQEWESNANPRTAAAL